MKKCPKCWHELSIDHTPEFNEAKPWELVCYYCGWFSKRYETIEEARDENLFKIDRRPIKTA